MDKPPPKKKRLIVRDKKSDSDDSFMDEGVHTPLPAGKQPEPIEQQQQQQTTEEPIKETTPVPEQQQQTTDETEKKNTPRLVMKKMVLNNFKSYAGRQVIGPFHKSFSAIVGPNGSGKSNVIDALLFVFGYRANKMRQGKLSELIHNSAKHPDLLTCSVEIHFQEIIDGDKTDEFTVVPSPSLVVSRQAYRNNSSKYTINTRTSTFTEVTTLLKSRGIDLDHKRFLILQGEVESIALMKPKSKDGSDEGLLEYLEDIIGTSKYLEPIEKASEELETLNARRAEKLTRVKFVSTEMDGMEDKKEEAERFLEQENELAILKNRLYQGYLSEAKDNIKTANAAIEGLKKKIEEEKSKYSEFEVEKRELEIAVKESESEYRVIQIEHSKLSNQLNTFEKQLVQALERKEHLIAKQKSSGESLESDRAARVAAQANVKSDTEELKKSQKELVNLESQLKEEESKLDEINSELKSKSDQVLAEIDQYQSQLAPWSEKISKTKKLIDIKKSERNMLDVSSKSNGKSLDEAKKQVDTITQSISEKKNELKDLPTKIDSAKSEIKEMEDFLSSIAEKEESCRQASDDARKKAYEARSSMKKSQSQGKMLDGVLRMKESGRIRGIHNRLGSLGVIDDQYDVAISTACPALGNIVVDTVNAGQDCIKYLRDNNLGRAQFIVLSKLGKQDLRPINTPENAPRLFDLVRPQDEKFLPAFYSVLQDTLVAKDMKQANRIAYGRTRWRVVTLDGNLIEKSGTMTGGGRQKKRGAMSSEFQGDGVSATVVAELEHTRDTLDLEYRNIVSERTTTETALRRKREYLPKVEYALERTQVDISNLNNQLEDEKARLARLEEQMIPSEADTARKAEMDEEIKRLKTEMADLKKQTVEIEATISSLHEEIMDAGGMDLRLQKICVNETRKSIDSLNNRITKLMVHKTKTENEITRLEASIVRTEKEMGSFKDNMKQLDTEREETHKSITEFADQVEESKERMKDANDKKSDLEKQLKEKTTHIEDLRQSEHGLKTKLDSYEKSAADNQKSATKLEDQIAKLKLHHIDDELPPPVLEVYTDEQLEEYIHSKNDIQSTIALLEATLEEATPNLSVIEDYRRRLVEYNERKTDLDAVTAERDASKSQVEILRKKRLDEFMAGFSIISQKLKEMYQMITLGGNAELELVDSLDPFSEGIVFSVMPPKKSWKNISNLSGGEKTLSSLALVFALHHFKPTPLYVMDEIDAALDFRNVSIVANYIAERTKNAQFVIISLRNNMFELADRLVGIYKTNHCTKSIAINPNMIATLTATPTNTSPAKRPSSTNTQNQQASHSSTPLDD